MPTFKGNHYVPVLTWKRGEATALQSVPATSRANMTPLIEIDEVPVDLDTGEATKTLDAHLDPAITRLTTAWGNAEFFLDPASVAASVATTGVNGAAYAYAAAQAQGLSFIPVVGLSRSTPELAAAFAHRQRGVCLRLTPADFGQVLLPVFITSFLATNQLAPDEVDLVLDLESIAAMQSFVFTSTAIAQLQRIPNVQAWRTLTLAGSAFPSNLGGIQGLVLLERTEWIGWNALHANRATLSRLPAFGDYGINSPAQLEGYDPRFMPMSPAIRYTLAAQWLILRGQTSRVQRLAAQFPVLAQQLVASPHFIGNTHCVGCRDAAACAGGATGFGAPEGWRRIGTAHHLVMASAQLAAVAFP